jgi:hypothetical protein
MLSALYDSLYYHHNSLAAVSFFLCWNVVYIPMRMHETVIDTVTTAVPFQPKRIHEPRIEKQEERFNRTIRETELFIFFICVLYQLPVQFQDHMRVRLGNDVFVSENS